MSVNQCANPSCDTMILAPQAFCSPCHHRIPVGLRARLESHQNRGHTMADSAKLRETVAAAVGALQRRAVREPLGLRW